MQNYTDIQNVPYLDTDSSYAADLRGILNNDLSINDISTDLKNYNTAMQEYLKIRGNIDSDDRTALDSQFLAAYESNQKAIKSIATNKANRYSQISNLITGLKNNKGYNDVMMKILSTEQNDETTNVTNNRLSIEEEIKNKQRHLDINNYYEQKYKKQNSVIKNVIVLLVVIIFISTLYKGGVLSENVYIFAIAIMISVIAIYVLYEAYDILLRDNHNFNEYNFLNISSAPSSGIANKSSVDLPLELQRDLPDFCYVENLLRSSDTS